MDGGGVIKDCRIANGDLGFLVFFVGSPANLQPSIFKIEFPKLAVYHHLDLFSPMRKLKIQSVAGAFFDRYFVHRPQRFHFREQLHLEMVPGIAFGRRADRCAHNQNQQ